MIRFADLYLRRGTRLLLNAANASFAPGWKIGLVGANGSGKSSLLALLKGQLHQDQGELTLPANWRIASVEQEIDATDQSALDFVLDGDAELRDIQRQLAELEGSDSMLLPRLHERLDNIEGYGAPARAAQLMNGLGFRDAEHARAVRHFSGGWRVRLALARALMCRSDLLLLDEPTNHLDLDAILWLGEWLREYRGTLVVVSHDRDFLDDVVDHVVHLAGLQLEVSRGNYSAVEQQHAERQAARQAAYARQTRQIEHMQAFVERFKAKASKARQAQSRVKALERLVRIMPAHQQNPFEFLIPTASRVSDPLLELRRADLGYAAASVLHVEHLAIRPGDRIGLLGVNGAGKSTFIKTLAGELPLRSGEMNLGHNLRIGYFSQHQLEQLDPQASALLHLQRLDKGMTDAAARKFIGGFGFSGDLALAKVATLSGGERARLALALIAHGKPNLLLLDEPTNHLDLEMRHALILALQDFTGALLLVSHDRHLIRNTMDRFLVLRGGALINYAGSLENYLEEVAETRRQARAAAAPSPRQNNFLRIKTLRAEVVRLERALERAHQLEADQEARLADNAIYQPSKADELRQLMAARAAHGEQIRLLEEQWLSAAHELEQLEPP